MAHHLYLHSEDLDGWLAPPNEPLLPVYRSCFRELEGLRTCEDGVLHEVRIVLNSGKAADYLEAQALAFGGRSVIACNGAAWRDVGGETRWYAPPNPDFTRLRTLLGLPADRVGVVRLSGDDLSAEVAIEEGKRVPEGDVVLTFFTEPEPVAHRWQFRGGIGRGELYLRLTRLIGCHRLALSVLEPHADGAVDIVPVLNGRAVAKWTLPELAAREFPGSALHLTHGGDGSTDLLAMRAPGVTPLSAVGCPATMGEAAGRGVLSPRHPLTAAGVLDCYARLAERGFYGPLSPRVTEIVQRHLASLNRAR